jgi:hypothetical protein
MDLFLPELSKTELTPEQVQEMDVVSVYTAFFLHSKTLRKFYRRTKLYLKLLLIKALIKERFQKIAMKLK